MFVRWLAPLASEAPEFIIATIFASRGKGTAAIATLISSKVNQWTLLIGSLPVAHLLGGGGLSLVLDSRQIEEVLLTATQMLMGVARSTRPKGDWCCAASTPRWPSPG